MQLPKGKGLDPIKQLTPPHVVPVPNQNLDFICRDLLLSSVT